MVNWGLLGVPHSRTGCISMLGEGFHITSLSAPHPRASRISVLGEESLYNQPISELGASGLEVPADCGLPLLYLLPPP